MAKVIRNIGINIVSNPSNTSLSQVSAVYTVASVDDSSLQSVKTVSLDLSELELAKAAELLLAAVAQAEILEGI